ncbi:MAG: relaxase domain-containing protein [Marmoricola sp.]
MACEFVERPGTARDKRPIREISGVPAGLCERWSQRRETITVRQRELARQFKATHGRPPTAVEAVALAQQANLETREAKHEPRSEAEQRSGVAGGGSGGARLSTGCRRHVGFDPPPSGWHSTIGDLGVGAGIR